MSPFARSIAMFHKCMAVRIFEVCSPAISVSLFGQNLVSLQSAKDLCTNRPVIPMRFPSRIFALLMCAILALGWAPELQADNSLLWRISGNGLEKNSYLYGTFHVADERAFHFNDSVATAFYSCEALALEVHFDSVAVPMLEMFLGGEMPVGVSMEEALPPSEAERLVRIVQDLTNMSEEDIRASTPQGLEYRLTTEVFESDKPVVVDSYFFTQAKQHDMLIFGLEDVQDQLGIFDAPATVKDWRDFADDALAFDEMRKAIDEMIELYREGDLDALYELTHQIESAAELEEAFDLVKRNYVMVNSAKALMADYSVFIGVGALHLPGEEGVIELLRKDGYTVEAVEADYDGNGRQFDELNYHYPWLVQIDSAAGLKYEMPHEPASVLPLESGELPFNITSAMSIDVVRMNGYLVLTMDMSGLVDMSTLDQEGRDNLFKGMVDGMSERFAQMSDADELTAESYEVAGQQGVRASTATEGTTLEIRATLNNSAVIMLMAFSSRTSLDEGEFDRFFNSVSLFEAVKKEKAEGEATQVGDTWVLEPEDAYLRIAFKSAREPSIVPVPGGRTYIGLTEDNSLTSMLVYMEPEPGSYYPNDRAVFDNVMASMMGRLNGEVIDPTYKTNSSTSEFNAGFTTASGIQGEIRSIVRGAASITLVAMSKDFDAVRDDAREFFASLEFLDAAEIPWTRETDEKFGYSVELPGEVVELETTKGTVSLLEYGGSGFYGQVPDSKNTHMATVIDVGPYFRSIGDTSFAHQYLLNFVEETGDKLESIEEVSVNGFDGFEVYSQSTEGSLALRGRAFERGHAILFFWLRQFPTELNNERAERFLNSIEIAPYDGPGMRDSKAARLLGDVADVNSPDHDMAMSSLLYYQFEADEVDLIVEHVLRMPTDDSDQFQLVRTNLLRQLELFEGGRKVELIETHFNDLGRYPRLQATALNVLLHDTSPEADEALERILSGNVDALMSEAEAILYPREFYTRDVFLEDMRVMQPLLKDRQFRFELYQHVIDAYYSEVATEDDYDALLAYSLEDTKSILANLGPRDRGFSTFDNQMYTLSAIFRLNMNASSDSWTEIYDALNASPRPGIADLAVALACENNLKLNEGAVQRAAADPYTRFTTYAALLSVDRQDDFPDEYATQSAIAESVMQRSLFDFYDFGFVEKCELVEEFEVRYGEHAGRYYLYRFYVDKNDYCEAGWYAAMSGPQPFEEDEIRTSSVYGVTELYSFDSRTASEHFDILFSTHFDD